MFCCVGYISTVLSSIGIWLTVGILNTDSMSLVDSVIKIVVVVGDLFMVEARYGYSAQYTKQLVFVLYVPPRAGVFSYVILI